MTTINKPIAGDDDDRRSFMARHAQKLLAAAVWLLLLGGFAAYIAANNIALSQIPGLIEGALAIVPLYIALYALRPILFFPASLLTVAGGAIYGPIGVLWVIVGSNSSALIAYLIGRFFGRDVLRTGESDSIVERYARRLRQNSFETVLIMRFIYLPYDLVNYVSGLLGINWRAFILATALGSIPGTIFFTFFGASFENLDRALSGQLPDLNPGVLAISITMFVVSLLLSRLFRRREARRQPQELSDAN